MRPHEKPDVWNKAVEFAVLAYKSTGVFPKEEKFGLTSQIRRAAVSVPANIAEGAARASTKEFAHFRSNAQGSASELETELLVAYRLGYFTEAQYRNLLSTLDAIGRMLSGLTRRLKRTGD